MKIELYPARLRGHVNYDWMDTYHSFSFGEYFNPVREQFGALRVLNDVTFAPGRGFSNHPHNNIEIINIPLSGILKHRCSDGYIQQVRVGEVQVISAGSGIRHSEYNASNKEKLNLLQIWIFPRSRQLQPRYVQKAFDKTGADNAFLTVVAPVTQNEKGALWIHQDAILSIARIYDSMELEYYLRIKGQIVYLMVVKGALLLENSILSEKDAAGIINSDSFKVKAYPETSLLLIEVPSE
jgi:quercetin 2,3-dioxygenase